MRWDLLVKLRLHYRYGQWKGLGLLVWVIACLLRWETLLYVLWQWGQQCCRVLWWVSSMCLASRLCFWNTLQHYSHLWLSGEGFVIPLFMVFIFLSLLLLYLLFLSFLLLSLLLLLLLLLSLLLLLLLFLLLFEDRQMVDWFCML